MSKKGSSPAPRGISTVYDLNDLLNELWHLIPVGKERKVLRKVERALHSRVCNGQNADCWVCQFRLWNELEVLSGKRRMEAQDKPTPEQSGFKVVRWLNESINSDLRARKAGQAPPQSPELLEGVHSEVARKAGHAENCVYCVLRAIRKSLSQLSKDQQQTICDRGFTAIVDSLSDDLESRGGS